MRVRWSHVAAIAAAAALLSLVPGAAAAPNVTSGDGITVKKVTDVSQRTFDVAVTTPALTGLAVPFGNNVRITLPKDYATSGKRYPVLYLLHGMAVNYRSWYAEIDEEGATANADVITVMPEGGLGWYTNWVKQTNGAQNWQTYHLDQLVPFIDRNLRTLGTREGRGIAGISMGGFGAMHYAQDRPDLFASVTSFSGAIALNVPTQMVIAASSAFQLAPPFAAFGSPFPPNNGGWTVADPVRRVDRLANLDVGIYVSNVPIDPVEAVVRVAAGQMHTALKRAGIAHTYVPYGMGGTCWGYHHPLCWKPVFRTALPRILSRLAPATAGS